MTIQDIKRPPLVLGFDAEDRRALGTMALGAAVIIPLAAFVFGGVETTGRESLRVLPDFGPLQRAAPMVLVHLAVALTALIFGVTILSMRKGTRLHRHGGRLWAGLMIGAAVSGMAIDIHRFTAAHAAALFVFWMIPVVVVKVRKGDLRGHRRSVAYLLIAMVIVSCLSLLPGHLLHGVFFRPV